MSNIIIEPCEYVEKHKDIPHLSELLQKAIKDNELPSGMLENYAIEVVKLLKLIDNKESK